MIRTGVNPFDSSFAASDRILFHWSSSGHDNGGETIFLSGTYTAVPEPATLALAALGGLFIRRRTA